MKSTVCFLLVLSVVVTLANASRDGDLSCDCAVKCATRLADCRVSCPCPAIKGRSLKQSIIFSGLDNDDDDFGPDDDGPDDDDFGPDDDGPDDDDDSSWSILGRRLKQILDDDDFGPDDDDFGPDDDDFGPDDDDFGPDDDGPDDDDGSFSILGRRLKQILDDDDFGPDDDDFGPDDDDFGPDDDDFGPDDDGPDDDDGSWSILGRRLKQILDDDDFGPDDDDFGPDDDDFGPDDDDFGPDDDGPDDDDGSFSILGRRLKKEG